MMEFLKVKDNRLLFYVPLSECSNCHKPMINWYKDVPREVKVSASRHGIMEESYRESGICLDCVKYGGFSKSCDCCNIKREFPREFKYRLTQYAEYPEDETEYQYICLDCISNQSKTVIEMLADSDDISEV